MSVPLDQREQQVEGFGSERDGRAIAQQKVFRRIQAEGAEFVDVPWLLVHHRFATPSTKGSATPARKYPESPCHEVPKGNHQEPSLSRVLKTQRPAGDP